MRLRYSSKFIGFTGVTYASGSCQVHKICSFTQVAFDVRDIFDALQTREQAL